MFVLKRKKTSSFEMQLCIVLLISLCIHTLIFMGYALSYRSFKTVLDFLNLWEKPPEDQKNIEKRIEFELVDTPDDAITDEKPDDTNLISDKNSKARDAYTETDKPEGEAYSDGDYETKEIERSPRVDMQQFVQDLFDSKQRTSEVNKNNDTKADETKASNLLFSRNFLDSYSKLRYRNEEFTREALMGQSKSYSVEKPSRQRLLHRQKEFSVDNLGGFSFNTYAWNWAPYLQYMKEKINSNLFPPPAFYRMGLISGETLVRFKVLRDGEITDIQVLKYTGHRSLMETSVNSLKGSDPLKPLPGDFPKYLDFLEVTARFEYIIGR